jgi:hypothetical protein
MYLSFLIFHIVDQGNNISKASFIVVLFMLNVQAWKLSVLICSGQREVYPHTRYNERDKMNILLTLNF